MKCIIYGLGTGRLRIERYLKNEHEIVGYSDSFYEGLEFNNKKFYKPQELCDKQFDVIIIAIGNRNIAEKIYSNLIDYNVDENKILDFYPVYLNKYKKNLNIPLKRIDRMVKKNYDGIILGISHAEVGINPKYLEGEFCNLAISSQDLFYDLRIVQLLIENYRNEIKNLKYVIIDMHKYSYFNYDVSLSKNAIKYYNWSGFRSEDCHNFYSNKNFNRSIEVELENICNPECVCKLECRLINLFEELFKVDSIDINRDYKETGAIEELFRDFPLENTRSKCLSIKEIEEYKNNCRPTSIQSNEFPNTIKENIEIFDTLIQTLKSINSKIKIYIVLIPQYKVVEDFEKKIEMKWRSQFYNILNTFKEKYKFKILDFKNFEEISSRNYYYYDLRHLNYNGATTFTKLLNSYIEYE